MFVFASLLSAIVGVTNLVAQVPATSSPLPAAPPAAADTLNNGACLDSTRAVPSVLQPPAVRSMQVVRIDKVVSTASMLPNEVIGFLYTLQDGSSWLGQRSADYMSAAGARQINQVLASTHLAAEKVTAFPPSMRYGVATKYQQFFKVNIPPAAYDALQVQLAPCVVWPGGRSLPDPKM